MEIPLSLIDCTVLYWNETELFLIKQHYKIYNIITHFAGYCFKRLCKGTYNNY